MDKSIASAFTWLKHKKIIMMWSFGVIKIIDENIYMVTSEIHYFTVQLPRLLMDVRGIINLCTKNISGATNSPHRPDHTDSPLAWLVLLSVLPFATARSLSLSLSISLSLFVLEIPRGKSDGREGNALQLTVWSRCWSLGPVPFHKKRETQGCVCMCWGVMFVVDEHSCSTATAELHHHKRYPRAITVLWTRDPATSSVLYGALPSGPYIS